ncbi:PstS family phosphate ABC transporter substrate-binding protein [Shumkonia mesophila]|uniref:PstS family phosphate ABC transporter substrate-binding protein n=1 Tax=Shumkonia mesophila TaxID=2838854 RepID=UPI0029350BA5|nr:substrate-binding domain-containing protein [Shumkonia mesophila]
MVLVKLKRRKVLASAAFAGSLLLAAPVPAEETVRVGGTGIGLELSRLIGQALHAADPGVATVVLPSIGTPGGIKALAAGAIDVAIAARPLKVAEKVTGIREAACMTTALVFATSRKTAPGLTLEALPGIYADPTPRWPDGQPLKVILRSPAGSENDYLVQRVPALEGALAAAFRRPGIPVGATDQENAALATSIAGSFAIATLLQIRTERLALTALALDGVEPAPETLADGRYPMPLRVCFLLPGSATAGAAQFIAFTQPPAGQEILRRHGSEPTR